MRHGSGLPHGQANLQNKLKSQTDPQKYFRTQTDPEIITEPKQTHKLLQNPDRWTITHLAVLLLCGSSENTGIGSESEEWSQYILTGFV